MRTATPQARHTVSHTLHGSHYLCYIEPITAQKTLKQAPREESAYSIGLRAFPGRQHTHTHTLEEAGSASALLVLHALLQLLQALL